MKGRCRRAPSNSPSPRSLFYVLDQECGMPELTRFRGTINATEIRKVPKIWQQEHKLGSYESKDGNTYSSKLSLWVPSPRNGEHIPGIFLRLANPVGSAYTRLTPSEFADLYTFFRTNLAPAQEAIIQAAKLIEIYRSAERTLLEHINTTSS